MRICLLEQTGAVPTRFSIDKRLACKRMRCGYFRLNWNSATWDREDPQTILKEKVTWAEGRSILFKNAFDDLYDYYIFMDDDIFIKPRRFKYYSFFGLLVSFLKYKHNFYNIFMFSESLRIISETLAYEMPVSGNIFCLKDWAHRWHSDPRHLGTQQASFSIACHDLQTHFFRRDFASLVFPTPIAGSGGSMWYAQFAGYFGWSAGQRCISCVEAFNTRHFPHQDSRLAQYRNVDQLLLEFGIAMKSSHWKMWTRNNLQGEYGLKLNESCYKKLLGYFSKTDVFKAWNTIIDNDMMNSLRKKHMVNLD